MFFGTKAGVRPMLLNLSVDAAAAYRHHVAIPFRVAGAPACCLKSTLVRASGLDNVMKCNVFCTSARHFVAVKSVYRRYFPQHPPARIFVCVPEWTGPFDIEIDCIAMA